MRLKIIISFSERRYIFETTKIYKIGKYNIILQLNIIFDLK